MNGLLGYFDVFLLVFARMGGAIFSNPMFTKRNVPMRVRAGLVPVSYTHLDVYKRQVRNRQPGDESGRGRGQ